MHLTITVTPIPLQQRSLDHASVGVLHDGFCSNNFYFTSVVEPTANSCYRKQESSILTAGKVLSRAQDCLNEILQLL